MNTDNLNYNFDNAIMSLKDGENPLNEAELRKVRVFGKLMLNKGNKFDTEKRVLSQFIKSDSQNHIRAELFLLGSRGQIITDNRVFVNVQIEGIKIKQGRNFWFVELVHPSIDIDSCESVEFEA